MNEIVKLWKEYLVSHKNSNYTNISERISDPDNFKNLFPDYENFLKAEKVLEMEEKVKKNANEYLKYKNNFSQRDLIKELKNDGNIKDETKEEIKDEENETKEEIKDEEIENN
jgi:protein subunit release factor A